MSAVSAVTPMSVMHEHVHQRTGEEDQEREVADDMRTMAGEDQQRGDGGNDCQKDISAAPGADSSTWI